MPNAGKTALGTEGNLNFVLQLRVCLEESSCFAGSALIDLKLPRAVEGAPGGAFELGSGVFGAVNVH